MTPNHASAKLQPESHTFRQFKAIFSHPHRFIESNNPYVDPKTGELRRTKGGKLKPDWRTETRYGIRPRVLLERFNDAAELIGLSFGSTTRYFCGDIDITSSIHPAHNEAGFEKWLGALEDIGLVRPVIIQSSFSGGLHVYFFFEEAIGTFNLACAVEGITKDYKIKIKSGELELFPNTKGYGSYYKGLKLPLQSMTGSYVLNSDYQPLTNNIDTFLNMAAMTAKSQDLVALKAACKRYGNLLRLERCSRGKGSLKRFATDLLKSIERGFTGAGQTNDLLLDIGCYGVVFERLDESVGAEALADYIAKIITSLEGYEQYCDHQHEIHRRALEVAKSSQKQYWAAGKPRKRQGNFKDNFGKILDSVPNGNQATKARAEQRLQVVLDHLEQLKEAIPTTVKTIKAFKQLLIDKSIATFEIGFSPNTLNKPAYKKLWLPVFTALVAAQTATTTTTAQAVEVEITPVTNTEIVEPDNSSPCPAAPVSDVIQSEVKKDPQPEPKIPQTPMNKGGYTPLTQVKKTESLEPLQIKEGTHLDLYGGFGVGEADQSQNLKNSSPSPSSTSRPITKTERQHRELESKRQEVTRRQERYYAQLQERHRELKELEDQRKMKEYQQLAKSSFAAIRRILGIAEDKSASDTPPPPI